MGWLLLFYLVFYTEKILMKPVQEDENSKLLANLLYQIDDIAKETQVIEREIKSLKKKDTGSIRLKSESNENESAFDKIISVNKKVFNPDKLLIEGDIRLDRNAFYTDNSYKRSATRDRKYLWHEKIIPYVIDKSSVEDEAKIKAAMNEIANVSCLTFVPYNGQNNWIKFVKKKGCWSNIGKLYYRSGSQDISIGIGCTEKPVIMHEIMHSLGFQHEHVRSDRNEYVEIMWENIVPDEMYNFNKESEDQSDNQGIEYDFDSLLHYGSYAFSKDKDLKTIVRLKNPEVPVGGSNRLSEKDILGLNVLYDCKSDSTNIVSEWSLFGPCDNSCIKYRQRYCASKDRSICPYADNFGVETQEELCSDTQCHAPINGHWERWSDWSECSQSCGSGRMTRTRKCEDPAPKYGGKDCTSESSQSASCNTHKCLGPNDCSFELNLCDWVPSNTQFKWQRFTGKTPSSNTGPAFDHSEGMNGKGYYLYTEASNTNPNDVALLTSKSFPATAGNCFSFWYHMYGSGTGSLLVFQLKKNGRENDKIPLKVLTGDQGNNWLRTEVTVRSNSEYQIIMHAIRGSSFLSDIAIDDITMTEKTVCASDEFKSVAGAKKLGCYKSSTQAFTSFKSMRNIIDWYNIEIVVEMCADFSEKQNSTYFGVQFYGECWYNLKYDDAFKSNNVSSDCFQFLVGRETSIMVYQRV